MEPGLNPGDTRHLEPGDREFGDPECLPLIVELGNKATQCRGSDCGGPELGGAREPATDLGGVG